MNICLFITDYFPNLAGAEIFAKNLAENLITHNHRVIIITAKKKKLKNYEIINNVEVFILSTVGTYTTVSINGKEFKGDYTCSDYLRVIMDTSLKAVKVNYSIPDKYNYLEPTEPTAYDLN